MNDNRANTISLSEIPKLKRAYNNAVKNGKSQFTVKLKKGNGVFLTSYAKYLLEYLNNSSYENNRKRPKATKT